MAGLGKSVLFLSYVFSYYILLLALVVFFFFCGLRQLRLVAELGFFSNIAAAHAALILTIATFAGLPPLFFFYPKLAVLGTIVLQGPWYFAVAVLGLTYAGWFMYLNVIRTAATGGWSFAAPQEFGRRNVNTTLATALVIFSWICLTGFFVAGDLFLLAHWAMI